MSDLISRQDVIEKIEERARETFSLAPGYEHYLSALHDVAEDLEQIPTIKPLTEIDYIELADRYGGEVAFVVKDMIEKTNQRWVLLNGERKDE